MNQNPKRDQAIEKRNEAYYSVCDKLIALSTGALALSVTFRSVLVPSSPNALWLLSTSWLCFSVTILSSLAVLWGKAWIWNRRVQEVMDDKSSDGRLPIGFSVARWLMFFSFLMAVVTFVAFALKNIEPGP